MFIHRIESALYRKCVYNWSQEDKNHLALLLKKMIDYSNQWSKSSLQDRFNNIDHGMQDNAYSYAVRAINYYGGTFIQNVKNKYGIDRNTLINVLVDSYNHL